MLSGCYLSTHQCMQLIEMLQKSIIGFVLNCLMFFLSYFINNEFWLKHTLLPLGFERTGCSGQMQSTFIREQHF